MGLKGLLLVLLLLLVSEVVLAAAKAARRPELARAVRTSELTVSDSMISSTVVSVDVWRKNNPDPMVLDLLRDCMRTVEKNKARK